MATELPSRLHRLILDCLPTLQAAEVLLFFAAHPERDFSAEEIVVLMRPTVVTVPAVKEYTDLLQSSGIVSAADGRFRYGPATGELEGAIGELARAYNERPVTLIATIYRIADARIQSFSDAFKLRRD